MYLTISSQNVVSLAHSCHKSLVLCSGPTCYECYSIFSCPIFVFEHISFVEQVYLKSTQKQQKGSVSFDPFHASSSSSSTRFSAK